MICCIRTDEHGSIEPPFKIIRKPQALLKHMTLPEIMWVGLRWSQTMVNKSSKLNVSFSYSFFYFAWPHYTNAFILLIFVDALEFNADALLAWLNSKAPQRTSSQRATPLMKGIEFSKGRKRGKEGLSTYSKKKNKASMDKHVLRFMLLNIFEPSSVSSGRHISPSLNSAPLYLLTL